jgi:hypothetical protein
MNKRTQKASGQTFIGFMRKTNARQKSLNYKSVSETALLSDQFLPVAHFETVATGQDVKFFIIPNAAANGIIKLKIDLTRKKQGQNMPESDFLLAR